MNRIMTCVLCGVVSLATASVSDAQIVRWGPGGGVRVRAPFVSVDVSPFGGARVRAPFTAVDSRVYGGYVYPPGVVVGPVPPVPPFPFPGFPGFPPAVIPVPAVPGVVYPESAPLGYQSARPDLSLPLPEQLRAAAEVLAQTLAVRQDGDVWLEYLGPQQIIEAIDLGRPPASLQDLVIHYDGVVSNRSLVSIQSARGFAETRDLLKIYVSGGSTPQALQQDLAPNPTIAPSAAVRTQPDSPSVVPQGEPLPVPKAEPAPQTTAPTPPPPPTPQPPSVSKPTPL